MAMSDLAILIQIFSTLAVLGTLIYLAIEVKQNTSALHAQTRQSLLAGGQAELFEVVEHPDICIIYSKPGELTQEEYVKLCMYLLAIMRAREYAWLQFKNGIIDEGQWHTERGVIEFNLTFYRTRAWWEKIGRFFYSPEFVAFVDTLIEDKPDNEFGKLLLNWES